MPSFQLLLPRFKYTSGLAEAVCKSCRTCLTFAYCSSVKLAWLMIVDDAADDGPVSLSADDGPVSLSSVVPFVEVIVNEDTIQDR